MELKINEMTFLLILWMGVCIAGANNLEVGACEPIKVDMCRQIGYNKTAMPNLAGHSLQADAKYELETFAPLIQSGCANELQFFLCFAYVPMCVTEATTPQMLIGPCRPMCERVRSSCLSLLEQFKYTWPPVLNCSKFPESNNHDHMCIEGPGESHVPLRLPPTSLHTLQTNPLFMQKVKEQMAEGTKTELLEKYKNYKSYVNYVQLLESNFDKQRPAQGINVQCGRFKKSSQYHYTARLDRCIPLCESDIIFTKEEKQNANKLIIGLSAACLGLSLLTFSTLLIDGALEGRTFSDLARKSTLYLTLASAGLCAAYLLSRFFRSEDLCIKSDEQDQPVLLAAQEGHRNQPCTVVFLFVYFFGSAVANWFTATSIVWCVASSTSNVSKRIVSVSTVSTLTHVFGWGIPAVLTIVAIVAHQVESDEFSSLCLPGGSQNDLSFLMFIVLPQAVQLFLGIVFAFVGVVLSFVRIDEKSTAVTTSATATTLRKKPKELQIRSLTMNFVIFSIIYILSAGGVLGINIYEHRFRSQWLEASQSFMPDGHLFTFRLFMTFLTASSTLAMIVTRESGVAWRKFFVKSFFNGFWSSDKQRTPVYPQVAYQPQATVENQVHIGHDYCRGQNL